MVFLTRSIEKTANIAGGYTVGSLVIDPQGVFIQLDDGRLVPATGKIEVKNRDIWQPLSIADYKVEDIYGNPAYAGLDARMIM